jgi:predicted kinase
MTLHIIRGIQGSGKSTLARELQRDVGGRVVERDEIRFMLYGRYTDCDEIRVSDIQEMLIDEGLRAHENVIVSDMNLRNQYVKRLIEKAWAFNTDYVIHDLTNVSEHECVARDYQRMQRGERGVGEDVIRETYNKYVKGRPYPLPVLFTGAKVQHERKFETYVPDTTLPGAIIVDIDGTVARMVGRGPFDEHLVHTDELIEGVAEMINIAASSGVNIIFMSGRTDGCYEATEKWLLEKMPWLDYFFPPAENFVWELHMRRSVEDRGRPDDIVKYEMFHRHVAKRYNVLYVIDDRNKVVKMWREIGLTCAQVAEGDF